MDTSKTTFEHASDNRWDDRQVATGRRFRRGLATWLAAGLIAAAGAVSPLLIEGLPHPSYAATAQLDVRGSAESDIDAAIAQVHSKPALDNLVKSLNLVQSGDFSASSGGALALIWDIVSGGGQTVSETEAALREHLSRAIMLRRAGGGVALVVNAASSAEAEGIANGVTALFRQELADVRRNAANPALTGMHDAMERAQAALSGFKAQVGEAKLAEMQKTHDALAGIEAQRQQADADLSAVRDKLAQASAMKLQDVLNKSIPDSLEFTALEYSRQRYVEAKLAVDQLSSNLGPRHPRFQAAQAAADAARQDIETALKQVVASLKKQEIDASGGLSDINQRAAALAADRPAMEGAAKLASLQAAVAEANDNYLQAEERDPIMTASVPPTVRVAQPVTTTEVGQTWDDLLPLVLGGGGLGAIACFLLLGRRKERAEADIQVSDMREEDWAPEANPLVPADALQTRLVVEDEDFGADLDLLAGPTFGPQAADYGDREFELRHEAYRESHDDQAADEITSAGFHVEDQPHAEHGDHQRASAFVSEGAGLPRSLADHIREVLMENRRSYAGGELPPLLAGAMMHREEIEPEWSHRAHNDAGEPETAEELQRLSRRMADLRERLEDYSIRRSGTGR